MLRILIVDDDKLARMGLEKMLPWEKYDMQVVGSAANGAKALECLAETAVDLMFVDLSMPVMTGLDLIRAAKAQYPNLMFVVLTFHEDFALVQQAMRLGVLDYISKLELEDADYDALCRRLKEQVESKRPESAPAKTVENLPQWAVELQSLCWIYDYQVLEKLIDRMRKEPISPSALEYALMRTTVTVEMEIGVAGPTVPMVETVAGMADFLRTYRETLIQKALADTGNARLSVCLLRAIEYIRTHLSDNLQTDRMANMTGLSRPYFSSSFSREVGISYYAYLCRERIEQSKRLLRETRLPMEEIARRVGFGSLRSLNKLFVEQEKQTPAAFRKNGKKTE